MPYWGQMCPNCPSLPAEVLPKPSVRHTGLSELLPPREFHPWSCPRLQSMRTQPDLALVSHRLAGSPGAFKLSDPSAETMNHKWDPDVSSSTRPSFWKEFPQIFPQILLLGFLSYDVQLPGFPAAASHEHWLPRLQRHGQNFASSFPLPQSAACPSPTSREWSTLSCPEHPTALQKANHILGCIQS